ncbi:MAG: hypothetical protein ACI89J_004122 [Hyphomicrobiaceae bacterium]|jgi:hypothetical protein
MKRTTKKLSGIGLELFLRRFYASYSGVDDTLARRLSKDSAKTFTSVRVRHIAWRDWRPKHHAVPAVDINPAPIDAPTTQPSKPQPSTTAENADTPFDPYAIGLIPIYQREGPEGLGAKLAGITSLDNLRKMARSQQIALPAELRGADVDIDAVRSAIIAAVGKRIANRRAAAG